MVSDNGTQFKSEQFRQFCKNNGIRQNTSSVYHPRSNGEAERFVQTFKNSMKKSKGELPLRMQCFLFNYRLTPHSTTGAAPSELMMGRRPRSKLDLIRPDVQAVVTTLQERQLKSYNQSTKARHFEDGEEVWIKTHSKNEKKRSLGKIIKPIGPVTYLVSWNGKEMKRHVEDIYVASKCSFNNDESTTSKQSPEKADHS